MSEWYLRIVPLLQAWAARRGAACSGSSTRPSPACAPCTASSWRRRRRRGPPPMRPPAATWHLPQRWQLLRRRSSPAAMLRRHQPHNSAAPQPARRPGQARLVPPAAFRQPLRTPLHSQPAAQYYPSRHRQGRNQRRRTAAAGEACSRAEAWRRRWRHSWSSGRLQCTDASPPAGCCAGQPAASLHIRRHLRQVDRSPCWVTGTSGCEQCVCRFSRGGVAGATKATVH